MNIGDRNHNYTFSKMAQEAAVLEIGLLDPMLFISGCECKNHERCYSLKCLRLVKNRI